MAKNHFLLTLRRTQAEKRRNTSFAQVAVATKERLVLKAAAAQTAGGVAAHGSLNEGYDLVDDDAPGAEERLLASLSTREKRALMKRLATLGDGDDEPSKKKRKKEKKKKKKKKKSKKKKSSSSSSSDSDS